MMLMCHYLTGIISCYEHAVTLHFFKHVPSQRIKAFLFLTSHIKLDNLHIFKLDDLDIKLENLDIKFKNLHI